MFVLKHDVDPNYGLFAISLYNIFMSHGDGPEENYEICLTQHIVNISTQLTTHWQLKYFIDRLEVHINT